MGINMKKETKINIIAIIIIFFIIHSILSTSINIGFAIYERNKLHILGNVSLLSLIISCLIVIYISIKEST